MAGRSRREVRFLVALGLVTVAALAIRVHGIDDRSLWQDELAEAAVAQLPAQAFVEGIRAHAAAAPLDYLGVKATTFLFGTSTVATRLWAVLSGTAAVAAMAWAAWEVFRSRRVALVSAALLAVAPFHVSYSQEARFYALATLTMLVALALFARAIRRSERVDWLLYGLAIAAALYTHYFAVVFVAAGLVAVVLAPTIERTCGVLDRERVTYWRRRVVGTAIAGAVAAVLLAPWVAYAVLDQAGRSYPSQLDALTPGLVLRTLRALLAPMGAPADVGLQNVVVGLTLVLAGIGALASRPVRHPTVLLVVLGVLVTIPAVWLADNRSGFFFHPRQVIAVLVLLFLLASAGIVAAADALVDRFRRGPRARLAFVAGFVAVFFVVGGGLVARQQTAPWRAVEDWRTAADVVAASICPASTVYVDLPASYLFGIGYYRRELVSQSRLLPWGPVASVLEQLALSPVDWVVVRRDHYNAGGPAGLGLADATLAPRGMAARDLPALRVYSPPVRC